MKSFHHNIKQFSRSILELQVCQFLRAVLIAILFEPSIDQWLIDYLSWRKSYHNIKFLIMSQFRQYPFSKTYFIHQFALIFIYQIILKNFTVTAQKKYIWAKDPQLKDKRNDSRISKWKEVATEIKSFSYPPSCRERGVGGMKFCRGASEYNANINANLK